MAKFILLFKIVASAIAGLVIWQMLGYLWLSEFNQAETMTNFLPSSQPYNFVCVTPETAKSLPAPVLENVKRLLEMNFDHVYFNESKIPGKFIRYTETMVRNKRVVQKSYVKGLIVDFRVTDVGLMRFRGNYTYYENPAERKNYTAEFVWVLGRWVNIETIRNF